MLPYLFVLLAIAVRFLPFAGPLNVMPHAWHFTPLAASLLFFGARGTRRQVWVPLALLMAADVVLTKFAYHFHLTWDQLIVWTWYGAILWLGTSLRDKTTTWRVLAAALTSSVSFFLVSNFAVWAAWPEMYPRGVHGLLLSYTAALPFFRGTLESDLFFSAAFFGMPVLVHALSERLGRSGNQAAAA